MTYEEFKKIFSSNMNVVEEYVLENSSVETIEKWTQKKAKKLNKKAKPTRGKNTLETWKVKLEFYENSSVFCLSFQ
jgi:prephenate dehydrogenase